MQKLEDNARADAELSAAVTKRAAELGWRLSAPQATARGFFFIWHPPRGPDMPCRGAPTVERALAIACGKLLDWHAPVATPAGPDLSPFGVRGRTHG